MILKPGLKKINLTNQTIQINKTTLTRVGTNCQEKSIKFLGIYIDDDLKWTDHIKNLNRKISNTIFTLNQIKNVMPFNTLKTLYQTMLEPHLTYGLPIWGNANLSTLKKTNVLQKKALRCITNSKFNSHTEPLFKSTELLKLNDLYTLEVSKIMYKYQSKRLPETFNNLYSYNHQVHPGTITRQSHQLHIPKPKNNFVKSQPKYNYPAIWNNIKQDTQNQPTTKAFTKHLKSYIISNYKSKVTCLNTYCKECN